MEIWDSDLLLKLSLIVGELVVYIDSTNSQVTNASSSLSIKLGNSYTNRESSGSLNSSHRPRAGILFSTENA